VLVLVLVLGALSTFFQHSRPMHSTLLMLPWGHALARGVLRKGKDSLLQRLWEVFVNLGGAATLLVQQQLLVVCSHCSFRLQIVTLLQAFLGPSTLASCVDSTLEGPCLIRRVRVWYCPRLVLHRWMRLRFGVANEGHCFRLLEVGLLVDLEVVVRRMLKEASRGGNQVEHQPGEVATAVVVVVGCMVVYWVWEVAWLERCLLCLQWMWWFWMCPLPLLMVCCLALITRPTLLPPGLLTVLAVVVVLLPVVVVQEPVGEPLGMVVGGGWVVDEVKSLAVEAVWRLGRNPAAITPSLVTGGSCQWRDRRCQVLPPLPRLYPVLHLHLFHHPVCLHRGLLELWMQMEGLALVCWQRFWTDFVPLLSVQDVRL
jgi:hypothetical protein